MPIFASASISAYVAAMDRAGQSPSLYIDDVSCVRGGRLVFEHVSLALEAGAAAMITGPNGAGKSSLLRVIAGLLPASAGAVNYAGKVALQNESLPLDASRTLVEALAFWAGIDGSAEDWTEAFGIAHLRDVPIRHFSTGQRKRASLALAFTGKPDILLLDEPANGLDEASLGLLAAAIGQARATGTIVMVASHLPIDLPGAQALRLGVPE